MGEEVGAFPPEADWHYPWLSPDDTRVAVEKTDPPARHTIWILTWRAGPRPGSLTIGQAPTCRRGHRTGIASSLLRTVSAASTLPIAADGSAPDTLVHRSREGKSR